MITVICGGSEECVTYWGFHEILTRLVKERRVVTNIRFFKTHYTSIYVNQKLRNKRRKYDPSQLVLLNDAELCKPSWDTTYRSRRTTFVIWETPSLGENVYYNSLPYAPSRRNFWGPEWIFCVRNPFSTFSKNCFDKCNYAIRVQEDFFNDRGVFGVELMRGACSKGRMFCKNVSYEYDSPLLVNSHAWWLTSNVGEEED